jgi:hypothetical protein
VIAKVKKKKVKEKMKIRTVVQPANPFSSGRENTFLGFAL